MFHRTKLHHEAHIVLQNLGLRILSKLELSRSNPKKTATEPLRNVSSDLSGEGVQCLLHRGQQRSNARQTLLLSRHGVWWVFPTCFFETVKKERKAHTRAHVHTHVLLQDLLLTCLFHYRHKHTHTHIVTGPPANILIPSRKFYGMRAWGKCEPKPVSKFFSPFPFPFFSF